MAIGDFIRTTSLGSPTTLPSGFTGQVVPLSSFRDNQGTPPPASVGRSISPSITQRDVTPVGELIAKEDGITPDGTINAQEGSKLGGSIKKFFDAVADPGVTKALATLGIGISRGRFGGDTPQPIGEAAIGAAEAEAQRRFRADLEGGVEDPRTSGLSAEGEAGIRESIAREEDRELARGLAESREGRAVSAEKRAVAGETRAQEAFTLSQERAQLELQEVKKRIAEGEAFDPNAFLQTLSGVYSEAEEGFALPPSVDISHIRDPEKVQELVQSALKAYQNRQLRISNERRTNIAASATRTAANNQPISLQREVLKKIQSFSPEEKALYIQRNVIEQQDLIRKIAATKNTAAARIGTLDPATVRQLQAYEERLVELKDLLLIVEPSANVGTIQ